jgi:hypothetical protein
MECDKKFVYFKNQYHIRYRGNAFYIMNGRYFKIPVDNRIMVDMLYFRKINPNYIRPAINELT